MIKKLVVFLIVFVFAPIAFADVVVVDEQIACPNIEGLKQYAPATGKNPKFKSNDLPVGCIALKKNQRFKGPLQTLEVNIYGDNTTSTVIQVEDEQHRKWYLLKSAVK